MKTAAYDKETGRFTLLKNNDNNVEWPESVVKLQREVLPSIQTDMIKIEYFLDVAVLHDGVLGAWQ